MPAKSEITASGEVDEFVEVCGYVVQRKRYGDDFSEPEAIQQGLFQGPIIRLGQKVFSNGRIHTPAGTMGLVVQIQLPYSEGKTGDVVCVWFEGEKRPIHMKFKDLEPIEKGSLRSR